MDATIGRVVAVASAVVTMGCAALAIGAAITSDTENRAAPPMAATNAPASSMTGSAAPGTTAAPAGASQAVTIANFAFGPAELTVPVGSVITWTNDDDVTHNVLSPDEVIASPDLEQGDTYEVTLDQEGTIDYKCDIHQFMRGSITVTP